MCEAIVRIIYFLFLLRGGRRSSVLESYIGYVDGELALSDDFSRNEPSMYKELFSLGCEECFSGLFERLSADMRGLERERSEDILIGLEFVQNCGATALWKFNLELRAELENFVRDFDRLDVPEERERLYLLHQN
ncbi:hypothetical protein D9M71_142160 [compost metagenome]